MIIITNPLIPITSRTLSRCSGRKSGADSWVRKIRGAARVRLWHAGTLKGEGSCVARGRNWLGRAANRRHIKRRSFKGAILFSPKRKGYHRRGRICLITGGEAELNRGCALLSISHPSTARLSTFFLSSSKWL